MDVHHLASFKNTDLYIQNTICQLDVIQALILTAADVHLGTVFPRRKFQVMTIFGSFLRFRNVSVCCSHPIPPPPPHQVPVLALGHLPLETLCCTVLLELLQRWV